MPKLKINLDIRLEQADNVHGEATKDMIVLHETVSPQVMNSLADIRSVSAFLDNKNFGIHGITDNDGNVAWARGLGKAIFFHTDSSGNAGDGHVNTRGIGIEMISRVMLDFTSNKARLAAWLHMDKELNATAKLMACISRAHDIPLTLSAGRDPGVTTHWEVTQNFQVPGGHTDCWPVSEGGYFPKGLVVTLARRYKKAGWHF